MTPKRKSSKPPIVQAAVIHRRAVGHSKSKIARDLKMNRRTVDRILSDAEVHEFVERSKGVIFRALPDIAETYVAGAKDKFERAESALERLQVIPARQSDGGGLTLNNFVGIGTLGRPDARRVISEEPEATGSLERTVR